MTRFAPFSTALGTCGIAWREDQILATRLPDTRADRTRRHFGRTGARESEPSAPVARAIAAVTALLEGEPKDLRFIRCDLHDTDPFARRVYEATRAILPGRTATYGEIASQLGDPSLARSVGQALGRNPIPIVVPCRRVMGADGRLTGFSAPGGVETKLRMLEIEGARIGSRDDSPTLFETLPLALKPRA